jgi:hypothetical protein
MVGSTSENCAVGGGNSNIDANSEAVDAQCPEDVGEEKELEGLL